MAKAEKELFFAVRWQLIGHYLGKFCLIVAALNLVTLAVALLFRETHFAASYAALVLLLLMAGGVLCRVRPHGRMQMNEAMVLITAIFLLVPLVSTIPMLVTGTPFLDAWFETVSAATTTGLSTLGSGENRPLTSLFARAWMQWYGGLGIVVFSLALVVRPGMSALRLMKLDAPDDLVGGTRAHARRVLSVYLCLTGCAVLVWLVFGGPFFEGVLFLLAAVSTGGFAPSTGSYADLDGLRLAWVATVAALAGAVPLALYHRAIREQWRELVQNIELRALLAAGLLITVLLGLLLWTQGMPFSEVLTHAPLLALSAQTTAGFSSLAPGTLDAGSKSILILAMASGGCVGSTAGGFKLMRLLILFGLLYQCLKSLSMPPDAVSYQQLGKRTLEMSEIQDALMIILMFILVVFVSWLPFLVYGYEPLDALFEVVSATGTVGLSSGVTQQGLPAPLKLVLCADMLLGRLEFVAWMVFLYPRTWIGRRREYR